MIPHRIIFSIIVPAMLLTYSATINAENSPDVQKIAETMVRLCVGGGQSQAATASGTGADISLQSFDAGGKVQARFMVNKSSAEGLVHGIDNAISRVAADQADKVRECLKPVRDRLLDVMLPHNDNTFTDRLISGVKPYALASVVTLLVAYVLRKLVISSKPYVSHAGSFIFKGILFYLTPVLTQAMAARFSLRAYVQLQLKGPSRYVRIPALTEVILDIDRIFVPLSLERAGDSTIYDHNSILGAGDRIQVIGDPGSGKSSFAKRTFRDACRASRDLPGSSPFPVLIELRHVPFAEARQSGDYASWLFSYLKKWIGSFEVYELETALEAYIKTAGVLLILDGLDEVSSDLYEVAQTAINGLAERWRHIPSAKTQIIITMRSQMHRHVHRDFSNSFPIIATLKRFSPTDIYEFLERWDFAKRKPGEVVRIFKNLTDHPNLREMCTNPLVLSMYVARDQQTGGTALPETRTDFYSRIAEELMVYRRAVQVGTSESLAVIREQRQRIFGRIAFNHMLDADQPANLLLWNDAVEIVKEVTGLDFDLAEQRLRQISVETGLISEERIGEAFRFIHLTFCEFFAAFEAIRGQQPDGWQQLLHTHQNFLSVSSSALKTRLVEILPFACALMPRHMRSQALFQVGQVADETVMAYAFLETKAFDHPTWPTFVLSREEALSTSADRIPGPEWLKSVHLFTVLCSDSDRALEIGHGRGSSGAVRRLFERLASRDHNAIVMLIGSYAEQDAAAAFRIAELLNLDFLEELPEVVARNCDQAPFLALVLERVRCDSARARSWTCAVAEAALTSRLVALHLWYAERLWTPYVAKLPKHRQWFHRGILPQNALTECLTVAGQTDEENLVGRFPLLLALIKAVRPPGARRVWGPSLWKGDVAPARELDELDPFCIVRELAGSSTLVARLGSQLPVWSLCILILRFFWRLYLHRDWSVALGQLFTGPVMWAVTLCLCLWVLIEISVKRTLILRNCYLGILLGYSIHLPWRIGIFAFGNFIWTKAEYRTVSQRGRLGATPKSSIPRRTSSPVYD